MRRTAAMVAVLPVLGGLLLLGGCATLESDGYWASSYPVYSRHIDVYEHRYRNPDGLIVVYDPGPRLYSVVSSPGLYWHDGHYYRRHRGHWEHSRYHRGPWAIHRHEPPPVRVGHEHPPGRPVPVPIAVPDRRHDRGPDYRAPYREPFGRPPPDRDRGPIVHRPPEPGRDAGRTFDPSRQRVEQPAAPRGFPPGPQVIPWIRGPDRVEPPSSVGAAPQVQRISRRGGMTSPPGPQGVPGAVGVDQVPGQARLGPLLRDRTDSDQPRNRPPVPGGQVPSPRFYRSGEEGRASPQILGRGPDAASYRELLQRSSGAQGAVPSGRWSAEREGEPRSGDPRLVVAAPPASSRDSGPWRRREAN